MRKTADSKISLISDCNKDMLLNRWQQLNQKKFNSEMDLITIMPFWLST